MQSPLGDLDDERWWASLGDGHFAAPWCNVCDRSWLRMTPTCPRCGGSNWSLRRVPPVGRLYSWVTVHRALDDEFVGQEPYIVGLVELSGGARLHVRVMGTNVRADEEIKLEVDSSGMRAIPFGYQQQAGRT